MCVTWYSWLLCGWIYHVLDNVKVVIVYQIYFPNFNILRIEWNFLGKVTACMQISQTQQNKSLHACVRWLWTATLQLVIWFHLEKKDVKILVCDSSATWGNLPGCESGQRSKPLVINWLGVTLSDLSTLSNELSRFLFTLFQS